MTRTVATVLRSGGHYDPTWVTRLLRAAERYLQPDRFVCLTDLRNVGCEKIPLLHRWPGWWAKLELWRPGLFDEGLVFYLDLDTLILQDFQEVWSYEGRFAALRDFTKPHIYASGLLLWQAGHTLIYERAHAEWAKTTIRIRPSRPVEQRLYRPHGPVTAQRLAQRRFLNVRHRMDPWWNQWVKPDILQDLFPDAIAHADLDPCAACNGRCNRKVVCLHGEPHQLCDELVGAWYR